MALAKLTPLRFSTVHGQSVLMNETKSTSSWQISDHWGICTTNRALLKGEVIEMELTGSGHMYIGLLASKPSGSNVLEGRSPSRIAGDNWVHFRLKNNNFVIKLEKTSGKEVTFYSGGDNPVEVLKIADCWLCCDLLFGDIEVKLLTKGKKKIFNDALNTFYLRLYLGSDIWLRTILIVRKETRCRQIGYSYRLTARVILYAPSHRQDNTYHGLCYTSRGALAGTRNSSMGPPHEGSIRRPIAP